MSKRTISTQEEKKYWDILEELADTSNRDLITYVHLSNVYVTDMKLLKLEPPLLSDKNNVIKDSVTTQTHDPEAINTIQVNYGKGDIVYHVTKQAEYAAQTFGQHKENIDKRNYSKFEAGAYATTKLKKIIKKEGYRIDLTVIASPHYHIGQICKVQLGRYDINDYFQIIRLNFKFDVNKTPLMDLCLADPSEFKIKTNNSQNNTKDDVSTAGGWHETAKQLETPQAIRNWIKNNVKYEKYYNSRRTVNQTFNNRRGNCYDQTNLAVAMMKHIGYNAWRVCGERCNGIAHCNGRVILNGRGVKFDTVCNSLNHL